MCERLTLPTHTTRVLQEMENPIQFWRADQKPAPHFQQKAQKLLNDENETIQMVTDSSQ